MIGKVRGGWRIGLTVAGLVVALPSFVAADLEPPFLLDLSHKEIEWTPGSSVELEATTYDFLSPPEGEKGVQEVNVTDKTSFEWSTSIGSLKSNRHRATLFTPKIGGEGKVTVRAIFEGETLTQTIGVKVCVNDRPTAETPCDTSPITPKSLQPAQTTTRQQAISAESAPTQIAQPISAFEACISQVLGGRRESTPADEPKIRECYQQSGRALPLAPSGELPVKPKKGQVKKLREAPEVFSVNEPENQLRTDSGSTSEMMLLLSGQGPVTTTIYLYLFSETRVESTSSDQNGAWSIEIIEPLEAGRHSLYVLAKDQGGEFVRSKKVSFGIGRAAATADNPEGKSLELVPLESLSPNYLPYMLGSFGLLLLVGLGVWLIWRLRLKRRLGKA